MLIFVIFNFKIVTRKWSYVLYLRLYLEPKPCNFPMIKCKFNFKLIKWGILFQLWFSCLFQQLNKWWLHCKTLNLKGENITSRTFILRGNNTTPPIHMSLAQHPKKGGRGHGLSQPDYLINMDLRPSAILDSENP